MTTAAFPLAYPRWRLLVWRHPELWAVLVSGGAWFFLIGTGAFTGGALHAYTGFAGHMHGLGVHTAWYVGLARIWPALALWAFMIAAMMFPPLIRQLRVVAARSLWPRRNRAMALFLLGYSALWLRRRGVLAATAKPLASCHFSHSLMFSHGSSLAIDPAKTPESSRMPPYNPASPFRVASRL